MRPFPPDHPTDLMARMKPDSREKLAQKLKAPLSVPTEFSSQAIKDIAGAMNALLAAFPRMELAVSQPEPLVGWAIRGVTSLPVNVG